MTVLAKMKEFLHHYTAPHEYRDHKPHLFTTRSLHVVFFALVMVQGISMIQPSWASPEINIQSDTIISLTNELRAKKHVVLLTKDEVLMDAAQARAQEMAKRGYFSHVSPEGKEPWIWFDKAKYDFTYAGENLAVNFVNSEDIHKAWIKSPSHYANLIKPQYTHIGIGIAPGVYEGNQTVFVVQFFAKPTRRQLAKVKLQNSTAKTIGEVKETPDIISTPSVNKEGMSQDQVLGTAKERSYIGASLHSLFATPYKLKNTILYIILALMVLGFMVAVRLHVQPKYKEILVDTVFIVVVIGLLIWHSNNNRPHPQVPNNPQYANEVRY